MVGVWLDSFCTWFQRGLYRAAHGPNLREGCTGRRMRTESSAEFAYGAGPAHRLFTPPPL